jgi:transposase InsO family protein
MTLICIESRWAGSWAVGPSRNRALAMVALDRLKERMQALGRSLDGVILHHDQDSVYTSHAWVWRVLLEERAQLSYTENGAKDNPWIESFWGRFKTENRDLLWEAETLEEVRAIINDKMLYYNGARRHSALAYQPPEDVLSARINQENSTCSVNLG